MTKNKSKKKDAEFLVPFYTTAAVGAAATPFPFADAIAISGIQVTMGIHIAHGIYGRPIGYDTMKALMGSYLASNVGLWLWSTVKIIPGLGTVAGIIGQMSIAGSITAALGYGLIQLLESNEPLTAESVKKAAKDNEERAMKDAEKAVNDSKDSIDIIQATNLNQDKDIATDSIKFTFNLNKLTKPRLNVLNISNGFEYNVDLKKNQKEISLNISEWSKGQYKAALTSNNSPEMIRFFSKK